MKYNSLKCFCQIFRTLTCITLIISRSFIYYIYGLPVICRQTCFNFISYTPLYHTYLKDFFQNVSVLHCVSHDNSTISNVENIIRNITLDHTIDRKINGFKSIELAPEKQHQEIGIFKPFAKNITQFNLEYPNI